MSSDAPGVVTLDYTPAFGDDPDSPVRPYLWLELTGLNGSQGPVRGLVDTGADTCVLPMDYAHLMGYSADQLQVQECAQVQGSTTAFEALEPCTAAVIGLEAYMGRDMSFEMRPLFIDGPTVLWGRRDFMEAFALLVDEAQEEFSLIVREAE